MVNDASRNSIRTTCNRGDSFDMSDDEKEVFGRVYRITHPKHHDECYIGRTVRSLPDRLAQHLSDAKSKSGESDQKLHAAMQFRNYEGFKIEEVGVAYSKCELVRLEHDTIKEHDSIDNGWNKVLPNPDNCIEDEVEKGSQYTIDGEVYTADSLSELCRKAEVPYSTVNFYRNKGQSVEEAVSSARVTKSKPKRVYVVHRQRHKTIRDIVNSRSNKYKLNHTDLKSRISEGLQEGTVTTVAKESENEVEYRIDPHVLRKKQVRGLKYSVTLPDGSKIGPLPLGKLHEIVKEKYPEIPGLTTVQRRITNPDVNKAGMGWTPEQAFGFEVPPNLTEVDKLVRESGYSYVPPVEEGGSLSSMGKPLILHEKKEVFLSQSTFCEEYGIDEGDFAKMLGKGMSLGDILEHYGSKP